MGIQIEEGESLVTEKEGSGKHFDGKLKQINFCDRRVYQRGEDTYYPSVTTILSAFPVDPFFLEWLTETGKNSEIIRQKAAREGSMVHDEQAIDRSADKP